MNDNAKLVLLLAAAAHELNRAYCLSLGDEGQPSWDEAPDWQKQSAMAGVEMHLANPDATPEQSHESWLAHKIADGWVYGEVKDAEKKEHPCCVPYAELPQEQKSKDYLFRAVVHAMKEFPIETEQSLQQAVVVASHVARPAGHVAIQYIGFRHDYVDRLYRTGLRFEQGQVRLVPGHIARQFLRHADLFTEADVPEVEQEAPLGEADDTGEQLKKAELDQAELRKKTDELSALHRHLDQINDKELLTEFGARYGVKIAKNASADRLAKAKAEIHVKIDQFGAV